MKCKVEEDKEDGQYYRTRTKGEYVYPTIGDDGIRDDGIRDDGMWLWDHQEGRVVSQLIILPRIYIKLTTADLNV